MNTSEQTTQQIQRAINKIALKFPHDDDTSVVTDIHLRAIQESGELLAFDDDETEINRCVIEEWINNTDEDFYEKIIPILRTELRNMQEAVDKMGIMKPYSFVLENDDKENIAELYLVDDDLVILGGDLMEGLDKDLDDFFNNLMK
ncbi:MAG: hypothetical protein IJS97_05920 [Prevotella sp.]|nr:hypothetical protein [Prevotella sp.]